MAKSILLTNATLLTHSNDDKVVVLRNHDILIHDGVIADIGPNLRQANSSDVLDCTDKIISPGFINTHAHLWQSQLKGRFSDSTLFSYLPQHWSSYVFTSEDIYLGQLAGCVELLDGGCTTVLDHSHGSHTLEHANHCLRATEESGIRAVWAYSEPTRLSSWTKNVCAPSFDYWTAETTDFLETAARKRNQVSCRVEIGLGFDLWFMPKEMTTPLISRLTAAGITTMTAHIGSDAVQGIGSPLTNIQQNHEVLGVGHLGVKNFVASHCMGVKDDQLELIKSLRDSGLNISISCTPTTEAAMCMHQTPAFNPILSGQAYRSTCSLGVDCHSSGMSYLPAIGTLLSNMVRINSNQQFLQEGKYPLKMRGDDNEIFNMMTIYGARALGRDTAQGGIGRIEVGRKADLVVVDTSRPGIGAAARHNPLDAILGFSNGGDVEHVFIEGVPVKKNFELLPIKGQEGALEWKDLRRKLLQSYADVQAKIDELNMEKASDCLVNLFRIDTSRFVVGG